MSFHPLSRSQAIREPIFPKIAFPQRTSFEFVEIHAQDMVRSRNPEPALAVLSHPQYLSAKFRRDTFRNLESDAGTYGQARSCPGPNGTHRVLEKAVVVLRRETVADSERDPSTL